MKVVKHRKPNEQLVTLLKELLVEAEAGILVALVGVGERSDKCISDIKCPDVHREPYRWLGYLRGLQLYFEHQIDVCSHCGNGLGCESTREEAEEDG